MVEFTKLEQRVIGELKEVYDPVLMNEQELAIEFQRIANSIGIEADEVRDICERWEYEKVRESMEEMDRRFKEKKQNGKVVVMQEDDGYQD